MKVVRANDVDWSPIFNSVLGKVIFNSGKVMFFLAKISPNGLVPEHDHPNEQMGICLEGKAVLKSGKKETIIEKGMFYWIKPLERHSVIAMSDKPTLFLDVFVPPREIYRELSKKVQYGSEI